MGRIEIVGLLGAGKTTLLNKIAGQKIHETQCLYEELTPLNEVWNLVRETNNNYFLLQASYYLESLSKIQNAIGSQLIITDFSLTVHHFVYSFYLLQKNLLNLTEWNVLTQMFDLYSANLPVTTGMIMIDAEPKELLENLHQRNRNLDSKASIDYLNDLFDCFWENKSSILSNIPLLVFKPFELKTFNSITEQRLNSFIDENQVRIPQTTN